MSTFSVKGFDGFGWSLDKDAVNTRNMMLHAGWKERSSFLADFTIYVTWNDIRRRRASFIRKFYPFTKWVVVLSNNPVGSENDLRKAIKLADLWIVANVTQKNILIEAGVAEKHILHKPFFVDENIFHPIQDKNQIFNELKIDPSLFHGKFVVSNFQRDSRGENLSLPKWQKNPDLFLEVIGKLKQENLLVLIAGPRRHYIFNKLREKRVNFFYYGDATFIYKNKDDIGANLLTEAQMNLLYNLSDINIVTSASEGGPKAIPESLLAGTTIISTEVGIAREFLSEKLLAESPSQFVSKIEAFRKGTLISKEELSELKSRCQNLCSFSRQSSLLSEFLKKHA